VIWPAAEVSPPPMATAQRLKRRLSNGLPRGGPAPRPRAVAAQLPRPACPPAGPCGFPKLLRLRKPALRPWHGGFCQRAFYQPDRRAGTGGTGLDARGL